MDKVITVTLWTMALFAVILFYLTFRPKQVKRILSVSAVVTAVLSMGLYCYGYAMVTEDSLLAVIRATFAVCKVFVGSSAYDDISAAPLFQYNWAQILLWLLQLTGLFTTTGAAISKLGDSLLRKLRLLLFRREDLSIIYGAREETLNFGRELAAGGNSAIVYVDGDSGCNSAVAEMGGVLRVDPDALAGNERFLQSLGIKSGTRKIQVYALQRDTIADQKYAQAMLKALEARGVLPEQTTLTIWGNGDEIQNHLLNSEKHYGYGEVIEINEPELAARMLTLKYPPCDQIEFDETGKAKEDFHAIVIGFGQVGQAVLRQIVMNGQFEGSKFRAAVFAPNCEEVMGRLWHEYRSMIEQYNIAFFNHDARSKRMYDYLDKHAASLKYIVVCSGSARMNDEIAEQIRPFLARKNCGAKIFMCSRKGVRHQLSAEKMISHDIYSSAILQSDQIDRMAMELNHSYCGDNGKTAKENWRDCDYFSRMSSRASVDYIPALLRMAHSTKQELLENEWKPEKALLENMAKSEHLRWNAFHFCMGFRTMTDEEFDERAEIYKKQVAEGAAKPIRLAKDLNKRIHACLIGWDELDKLSEKEKAITGKDVDYKREDRKNVLAMKKVVDAGEKKENQVKTNA